MLSTPEYVSVPRKTNLVAGSVTQTGEEGGELATNGGIGVLLENDLLEVRSASDLFKRKTISTQLRKFRAIFLSELTRDWLLINRLAVVSTYWQSIRYVIEDSDRWRFNWDSHTGWKTISSAIPAEPVNGLAMDQGKRSRARHSRAEPSRIGRITYRNRGDEQWQTPS